MKLPRLFRVERQLQRCQLDLTWVCARRARPCHPVAMIDFYTCEIVAWHLEATVALTRRLPSQNALRPSTRCRGRVDARLG
jgi:hypothetical protein